MYICMDECMNVSLCAWFYQVLYVLLLFVVSSRLYRSFIRSFVRLLVFSKSQACCRYGEKYLGQVNLQPSTNSPKLCYSPIP